MWARGVWLGHARASNTSLVSTDAGIVKALAVRRLTESEQWDGELLTLIYGFPKCWKLAANDHQHMVEFGFDGRPESGDQVRVPHEEGLRVPWVHRRLHGNPQV